MWSLWACETITASRSRGSNVNWRFGLFGVDPIGVEQPAVEQEPVPADLQQVGAARHLPGRAMERDAQPIILPPVHPPTVAARRPAGDAHGLEASSGFLKSLPAYFVVMNSMMPRFGSRFKGTRSRSANSG